MKFDTKIDNLMLIFFITGVMSVVALIFILPERSYEVEIPLESSEQAEADSIADVSAVLQRGNFREIQRDSVHFGIYTVVMGELPDTTLIVYQDELKADSDTLKARGWTYFSTREIDRSQLTDTSEMVTYLIFWLPPDAEEESDVEPWQQTNL